MARITAIPWARSTFNPWIGCTEVSTEATGGGGCDGCYARELDKRHRWGGAEHWGHGVPRHHTAAAYWLSPAAWDVRAELEQRTGQIEDHSDWHTPGFWPVFPSLCDPFDNEVPDEWRAGFWQVIHDTPHLTWLLLTKRVGNVEKMLPEGWATHPECWKHVRLGVSVVNQKEADRDVPRLAAIPAASRFVSYEPALDEVQWGGLLAGIAQMIVGGESRQGSPRRERSAWRGRARRCARAVLPARRIS
jgi:protein gp37